MQVAGDVLQLRQLAQLALQLGHVVIQFGDIWTLQGVLILALGQVAANANGRQVLHVHRNAGDLREFRPQFFDDLVGTGPGVARLQPHEDAAGIGGGVASIATDSGHARLRVTAIGDDLIHLLLVRRHLRERDSLGGFGRSKQLAGIFVG